MKRGGNQHRGGYSAEAVAKGRSDHGDPRTKTYARDQVKQAEQRDLPYRRRVRAKDLQTAIKEFESVEASAVRAELGEAADRLKVVFDRSGQVLSTPDRRALLRERVKSRSRYLRSDGKTWAQLRTRVTVIEDDKKVRKDIAARVIYHEAIMDGPVMARMLALAALAGGESLELARQFNAAAAPKEIAMVERLTGLEVVDLPYHPKPLGGHSQPEMVCVNAEGKKLGRVASLVNLGRKMLGALNFMDMGFKGDALDALTGVPNSEAGVREALGNRGGEKRCVDVQMHRQRAAIRTALLKESRFAALVPFFQQAQKDYDGYLERRRRVIADALAERKKVAELEARATKAEALATDSAAALERSMGLLQKAGADLKAQKAENAALKASPVFVVHNGQRWTPHQIHEALERLAAGQERGMDEFILDDYSGVAINIVRQLEAFEKLPDLEVSTEAAAALRAAKFRNERWLEIGKKEVREDVRKTEKKRPPEEGDEWKGETP